jgi:hypothetical protein
LNPQPLRQHAHAYASRVFTKEIDMFGWLSARSTSPRRCAPRTVESRRIRRITPHALIGMLPGLGKVLYLHGRPNAAMPNALPHRLLIAQPSFASLLDAHWLIAVSAVTDDGPREWCECMDLSGRTLARWHLLPDTDYLAWDVLTASCKEASAPIDTQALRPHHANVVHFRLRAFAGMQILDQDLSSRLSPLGGHIAARIAHAEAALLQP